MENNVGNILQQIVYSWQWLQFPKLTCKKGIFTEYPGFKIAFLKYKTEFLSANP